MAVNFEICRTTACPVEQQCSAPRKLKAADSIFTIVVLPQPLKISERRAHHDRPQRHTIDNRVVPGIENHHVAGSLMSGMSGARAAVPACALFIFDHKTVALLFGDLSRNQQRLQHGAQHCQCSATLPDRPHRASQPDTRGAGERTAAAAA